MYKATRIRELCYCKKWLGDTSLLDTSALNDSVVEETHQATNSKRATVYRTVTTDETENKRILDFFIEGKIVCGTRFNRIGMII